MTFLSRTMKQNTPCPWIFLAISRYHPANVYNRARVTVQLLSYQEDEAASAFCALEERWKGLSHE